MKNEEHEDLTRVAQTATATTVALPQSGNEPKSRTPGPWQVDPDDLMPNHPLGVAVEGPNGVWVSDHSSLPDAYLIAAAPDLLEALDGLLGCGRKDLTNPKYDGFYQSARAAIEKACGR